MSVRSISLGIAVAASMGGVWLASAEPASTTTATARDLARPFVLPALWAQISAAERSGELPVAVAVARTLLRYVPHWIDGHMHFAARIAFDHGGRAATVDERLRALDAGTAWLEEARTTVLAHDPAAAAELAAAQATFLLARCDGNPDLAAAIQARSGRDPAEIARESLDRAIASAPSGRGQHLEDRRAFLMVRVIAAAIRTGDLERAAESLDVAVEMLRRASDSEASAPWVTALSKIRPLLHGEHISLDALRKDPYLEDIIRAYEAK